MDLMRTPLDQTLALLDRSGRRWSERMFNDRVLDRESVAELLIKVLGSLAFGSSQPG
jgi:hypothetical protein